MADGTGGGKIGVADCAGAAQYVDWYDVMTYQASYSQQQVGGAMFWELAGATSNGELITALAK
ncbi:hypothetical protein [Amycolatopsis sp. FDAARGOS 1241]|uniref:hypothetical protein n=1 Tax=Amycolatopsis sp. FDAARGOS 1241 TaxID=2778070 RepID=UPI00194FE842|nr:hypothetical protein [Amycolatopsis sp. FDAARGOS 1241]QRP44038.1 hypothetical protein I6J71_32690 [Amycolatopsis sp. FDAARGOS 1241]